MTTPPIIDRHPALRAIILAAGKDAITEDGRPLILQPLGDRSVLEHVIQNVLQLVPIEQIYVVVGYRQQEVRERLGSGYHYVYQEEPLGTAHAVLQAAPLLENFSGNLLIVYGDTPLFRPESIRGLVNRHHLKQSHLTLLAAKLDRPLPYGRIIRNAGGQMLDVIEEDRGLWRECARSASGTWELMWSMRAAIFAALRRLSPSPRDGHYRLTDCVHELIRSGLRVDSYRTLRPG